MADLQHDLLLAALAQLTELIPGETLQPALARWKSTPGTSLADHLSESVGVDPREIEALRLLVTAHLERHHGDVTASLAAWNAQARTQSIATEPERERPGTTLGASPGAGETLPQPQAPTLFLSEADRNASSDSSYEFAEDHSDQRFKLIRPHARGGIGEVWLALDRELQREVAVKEIQARYVGREDQRKRFLLEAEITGSLEHPGIVPVYSLGRNDRGLPYYAMRFIRGDSLATAIRRFHESRRQGAPGRAGIATPWGVEFQQLLRRFLEVCDAMEYAHSRKVIHRDLKPANIMLGEYGETLVVDWGLAKIIGQEEIPQPTEESAESEIADPKRTSLTASVSGETQPGITIGTPSYMSPEQAHGDLEHLSPASDVYSLGATLFELLTGKFPFAEEKAQQIIERVKAGALTPPRALVPSIPAALESICLKAMAFRPADRYQSARELALDLEHWMADEPVTAHRESPLQRLARWLRRHRSWTYAGAASLLGITLATTVALFMVDRARHKEEMARLREADARIQAEEYFALAQKAVDEFLTKVSENTLLREQETTDLRKLRRELLGSALPFYQRFVEKSDGDPAFREQLANAYLRQGSITADIENTGKAVGLYQESIKLWNSLLESDPNNIHFQTRLADCYLAVGRLRREVDHRDALHWLGLALKNYKSIAARKPTDRTIQASLANCHSEIGICHSHDQQPDKALEALSQARVVQERLVATDTDNIDERKNLAEILNRIGYLDFRQHHYDSALLVYEKVQGICIDVLNKIGPGPKPSRFLLLLAMSHYNIGAMKRERSGPAEALACYQEAEKTYSKLVDIAPSVTRYRQYLAEARISIASMLFQLKRYPEARAAIAQAATIFDELSILEQDNAEILVGLSQLLDLKGILHDADRRNDLAKEPYEKSLEIRRKLHRKSNGDELSKSSLCTGLTNLGENYVDQGEVKKGLELYLEALGDRRELASARPSALDHALNYGELALIVGEVQAQFVGPRDALQTYSQARELIDQIVKPATDNRQFSSLRAELLRREGPLLSLLGTSDEALGRLRRALEIDRGLVQADPDNPDFRCGLTESFWELATTLQEQGQSQEPSQLDRERRTLWQMRPADPLVNLAVRQAARANIIGYGKTTLPKIGEATRKRALDRAAASLHLALQSGFKDLERIKSDPDLAPLLERSDLKAMIPPRSP